MQTPSLPFTTVCDHYLPQTSDSRCFQQHRLSKEPSIHQHRIATVEMSSYLGDSLLLQHANGHHWTTESFQCEPIQYVPTYIIWAFCGYYLPGEPSLENKWLLLTQDMEGSLIKFVIDRRRKCEDIMVKLSS